MTELTAETVVDRQVPRTPQLSPDGRWVVYAVDGGLWLVPADGGAEPREFATGREPRWAADSATVFFLSDRDEEGKAQLYRAGTDGDAERLTDWATGVSGCVPVPDAAAVVVLAPGEDDRQADPRVRQVTAGPGARTPAGGGAGPGEDPVAAAHQPPVARPRWDTVARPDRLWLLDPGTETPRPLADLGRRHVVEAAARPDGRTLAVLTWSVADREPGIFEPGLHFVDLRTGAVEDLPTPALEATGLTWWRDETGWRLVYLGLTPPGLVGGHAVFDADGRNLTAGLDGCPTELAAAGDGPPLVLVAEGLDTTIRRLPDLTEVANARGSLAGLTANGAGEVALVASTAAEPDAVHAGPAAGPLVRLTTALKGDWAPQERLAYRAEDGLELDGLLLLPPGTTRSDGPFPLVTLIHGGPHDRYADRFHLGWYPSGQWLAAAGFAVFQPNGRGGLGHGDAFARSVAGEVGGAEFTDVLAGIDLLVEAGVADEDRLGIGGWSHGGFVAAWAVTQTDRFKAAVVGAGVIDWPLLAATGEHTRFEAALGGLANSPITHAHRIRTPVLILHGEGDPNVPLSQAELLHRALHDREHEFVVYPREGHSIRERDHRIDVLNRTRAWFSHLLA